MENIDIIIWLEAYEVPKCNLTPKQFKLNLIFVFDFVVEISGMSELVIPINLSII